MFILSIVNMHFKMLMYIIVLFSGWGAFLYTQTVMICNTEPLYSDCATRNYV